MLKITLAAAAIAAATLSALPSAEARSLSPRDNVVQSETLVINVGHRAERRRDHRRARSHYRRLHRGQVIRRLSWRGFYGFSRVRDRGSVYAVKAFSPRGYRVRLRVDAYSGEIVHRRRVGRGWRRGGQVRFSW